MTDKLNRAEQALQELSPEQRQQLFTKLGYPTDGVNHNRTDAVNPNFTGTVNPNKQEAITEEQRIAAEKAARQA